MNPLFGFSTFSLGMSLTQRWHNSYPDHEDHSLAPVIFVCAMIGLAGAIPDLKTFWRSIYNNVYPAS